MSKTSNTSENSQRGSASKVLDPVFICMCGAVALAIGSSVLLRVMSGGASAVQASESESRGEVIFPAEPLKGSHAQPGTRAAER